MATLEEKLAEAQRKTEQIKAQIQAAEARKVAALVKGDEADEG
jgi:hypothetical protein